MSMLFLELAALSIVTFYIILSRAFGNNEGNITFIRFALIAAASWITEETCILLYRFYGYSPGWRFFLSNVPIIVIVIWPAVIHSARNLAIQLVGRDRKRVPFLAAGIVWTDASLIETVAVSADLWHWNEPGIFNVPLIGIFGWAFFAFLCILVFEVTDRKNLSRGLRILFSVIPVVGTHLLLVCTWWLVFRWINTPVDSTYAAGTAWSLSLLLVYGILKYQIEFRVETKALVLRLPAALLVFLLLALSAGASKHLVVYAAAFVPPYLALMAPFGSQRLQKKIN